MPTLKGIVPVPPERPVVSRSINRAVERSRSRKESSLLKQARRSPLIWSPEEMVIFPYRVSRLYGFSVNWRGSRSWGSNCGERGLGDFSRRVRLMSCSSFSFVERASSSRSSLDHVSLICCVFERASRSFLRCLSLSFMSVIVCFVFIIFFGLSFGPFGERSLHCYSQQFAIIRP
jgi:hypothetical protein